jgi:hypothetical protein
MIFEFDKACFLLVATPSNKRLLKAGRLLQIGADNLVIEFEDLLLPPVDADVTLLAHVRGKFFQQAAKVVAHRPVAAKPTAEFKTIGEAISAEQRGSYRISVINAEIHARVGRLTQCPVADVSPEGLSVICGQQLEIGGSVEVEFMAEGIIISGTFRVQSVKPLSPSQNRYGLFAPDKQSDTRRSLEKLSGIMQRYQLKRLSGAA